MSKRTFKLSDRIKSFKFALNGIVTLLKKEHNARIHALATIVVLIASLYFRLNEVELCLVIVCIGLVFITELINTAIENIADFIEPSWNKKIGEIKDYSAGAVLISALVSLIIGAIIFAPKMVAMF